MLKRITSVKNFGIFKDYRRDGTIQDFKKLNIFYGWNYSGKTTISRLIYSLETKQLDPAYPNGDFKIVDYGDKEYTQANLNLTDSTVRVFNVDFVNRNLRWNGEAFDAILLLGEDAIKAKDQLDKEKVKLTRANKILAKLNHIQTSTRDKILSDQSDTASEIKVNLGLVEAFTRTHFTPIFERVKNSANANIISLEDEQSLLKDARASENDKLPLLQTFKFTSTLTENIDATKTILTEVPDLSEVIEHLKLHPEVSSWVETGLYLHKDKDICEYCQNRISDERKLQLANHFSQSLKNFKLKSEKILSAVNSNNPNFPAVNERQFYPGLRENFKKIHAELSLAAKNYAEQLSNIKRVLLKKNENPFEKIDFPAEINDCTAELNLKIASLNTLVDQNNAKTEAFEKEKSDAINKLKNHFVSKFVVDKQILARQNKILLYQNREIKFKTFTDELQKTVFELEAKISSAQKGREKLNEYIYNFLGRDEIKIEVIKDLENKEKYVLKRDTEKATHLSEGEKTAIAFSFFLTKLLEGEDFDKTIVYIDDPISSLDSNHIFQVTALLKNFFFSQEADGESWKMKNQQLFVSTHNFEFLSLLRDLPAKKADCEYYFVRRISRDTATLSNLPKAIKSYPSEYHFLFEEIHTFHKSEKKDDFATLMHIPNAVRRFTELYTYSKIPSHRDDTVDIRMDKLFGKEKAKRIVKVLHHFSHSNNIERILKNNDLICDIASAVDDLMTEIKKDTLHYDALVKSLSSS